MSSPVERLKAELSAPPPNSPGRGIGGAWMMIFTDLVLLLLTFFVLLFSMSELRQGAFDGLVEALSRRPTPEIPEGLPLPVAERTIPTVDRPIGEDLGYLESVLAQALAEDPRLAGARLEPREGTLVLTLPADLLFPPNGATLSDPARRAVGDLASGVLANLDNRLAVSGHAAPPRPTGVGALPGEDPGAAPRIAADDPWALSLARATAVARALGAAGYPAPLSVLAHGDSRFADLADLPPLLRRRFAARVDLMILPQATETQGTLAR
ncbi:OmpA/MotB family protein [Roseospirillum parvum]|uniref:Chemotaxis protein MotB n=1 Tax=Roseospirillum parvum TaxID=83401 RepID=A0A1G8FGS6_9PROT|nr:flagellar motor protein MotB [Roseospirillum parvum]SDH81337.1 chemotaxis protein MotB [Roseospirillum parvum]